MNRTLQAWEHISNTVHAHQAPGDIASQRFLVRHYALRVQAERH